MCPRRLSVRARALAAALLLAAVGGLALVLRYGYGELGRGIPCPVYALTGLYCPGCGSGRAVHALLEGQLYRAFRFNPLAMLLLPWLTAYFLARLLDWVLTGENHIDRHIPDRLLVAVLWALMVYGVLRNIPLGPFLWLRPGG